jgi:pSer/pThr/pTyr-binding forkhead associated (FHA) protein
VKYSIGRNKDNDIVIDDPEISGKHCLIEETSNGYLVVEDLNSTNHTYINELPIKISKLYGNGNLRLANHKIDLNWLAGEISKIKSKNQTNFKQEFQLLKKMHDDYQLKLREIDFKYNKKNLVFRSIMSLIPLSISVIISISCNSRIMTTISTSIGTATTLFVSYFLLRQQKSPTLLKEKEDCTIEFLLNYRCPKCGMEFGNRHWKLIEANKVCPKCKSEFV